MAALPHRMVTNASFPGADLGAPLGDVQLSYAVITMMPTWEKGPFLENVLLK